MNPSTLLTIVVPTYNRAHCLELLLGCLATEIAGIEHAVAVIVGDNASTDDTPEVTGRFQSRVPSALVIRHDHNLGPEENFCRCIERITSPWFWIIGDDDLPRAGAVRHVLDLLVKHRPDLVYLESEWRPKLVDNDPGNPMQPGEPVVLRRLDFARRVHVWMTFISGMVVNREVHVAPHGAAGLRRYSNSHLVQLGWVLGTLEAGNRFLTVKQRCVLATQGNTGGYSLLKVFGSNFPAIVSDAFGAESVLAKLIVRRCAVMFLPDLLWSFRFAKLGSFAQEDADAALRPQLGRLLSFWLLLRPISRWPSGGATAVLRISHMLSRFIRVQDRVRERLASGRVS